MLWDLIRDFFVQHVFGGFDSAQNYYNTSLGQIATFVNGENDDIYFAPVADNFIKIGNDSAGAINYIDMADWLSTTATAISITIIVVLCCLFVYKIIKLIGGLIR